MDTKKYTDITDFIDDKLSEGHSALVGLSNGRHVSVTRPSQAQLEDANHKLPNSDEVEGFYQVEIDEKNTLIKKDSIISVELDKDVDDSDQPGINFI